MQQSNNHFQTLLALHLCTVSTSWISSTLLAEWCGTGVVVCLERGADLHMAQLMPLPLTVSRLGKIQIGLPFWYQLTWVVPNKGPLNGCVCVLLATIVNLQ